MKTKMECDHTYQPIKILNEKTKLYDKTNMGPGASIITKEKRGDDNENYPACG